MSGFVETLDSYRSGTLSRDELLAEIERQLAAGEADPGALLAALNNEQARERLPGNIHIEIVRKLLRRRDTPAGLETRCGRRKLLRCSYTTMMRPRCSWTTPAAARNPRRPRAASRSSLLEPCCTTASG